MEMFPLHLIQSHGFSKAYMVPTSMAKDSPEGIAALLLLMYPYDFWGEAEPGCVRISSYYFAAQDAYHRARGLVKALLDMGETARLCNEVRLKPLLSRLKDFSQGRNTLHHHKDFGSRFHVQIIGIAANHFFLDKTEQETPEPGMCGLCRRCLDACPTKALTEEGFQRDKCLRQHMMSGKAIPVDLRPFMENRLLGCDICQQVCPYNRHFPNQDRNEEGFPLNRLLRQDAAILNRLSEKIGKNMALPNRVCAQACVAAGNSKNAAHLPILDHLCAHPSPVIAEHARWAVKELSNMADSTTT